MNLTKNAEGNLKKMFTEEELELKKTDPEFFERYANFAFDEVVNTESVKLDDKTRMLAILATLLGSQSLDTFKVMLPAALQVGVTPVEAKEVVYQAVDYLGFGRVYPFLTATNEILKQRGVKLPLPTQATTTMETRLAAGVQAQVDIFGPGMKEFYKTGPADSVHINRWLAGNCFGDYYTRKGLDLKQREMITFCYIAAQGGCEPQLIAHAGGNMNLGNDAKFLIKVISQCLPYIGYPRSLNALNCVRTAATKK
jgi:4-carboxymuconolactone decarboxylase